MTASDLDEDNLIDLRSRSQSPIDSSESKQQAPVAGVSQAPQPQIQKTSLSESDGDASHSDGGPRSLETTTDTTDTCSSFPDLVLERIENLDSASHATTSDLLEEFSNIRQYLRATTKLDDTMLAAWLLNSIKLTHPALYEEHMAGVTPSLTTVLPDFNKLQEAERGGSSLASTAEDDYKKGDMSNKKPESVGKRPQIPTCAWCQKKHGGRVCFWVFPEALPDDWYNRDRFLLSVNAWLATDEGKAAREKAFSQNQGVKDWNGKKGNITRDDICWSTNNEYTVFNNLKWFVDIDMADERTLTGLGGCISSKGKGTVRFHVVDPTDPSKRVPWTQRGARYNPCLPINFLSAGHCRENGYDYDGSKCAIVKVDTGVGAAAIVWKKKRPFLDTPSVELSVPQAPCF